MFQYRQCTTRPGLVVVWMSDAEVSGQSRLHLSPDFCMIEMELRLLDTLFISISGIIVSRLITKEI